MLFVLGGVGVLCRYLLGMWIPSYDGMPISTLVINVLGSFLIGLLFTMTQEDGGHSPWQWAVMIGFLGSMTTFSSFSLETLKFFQEGLMMKAFGNVLLNNILSLSFCSLGWMLGKN